MSKVKYLLLSPTDKITYEQLLALKNEYHKHLRNNRFISFQSEYSILEVIKHYKRRDKEDLKVGPYSNISFFEAANRIASDLVIIKGLLQICKLNPKLKEKKFTLYLGSRHKKHMGDFLIGNKHGEAFNVAPSFYKSKIGRTISAWRDKSKKKFNLNYIFVNDDAVELGDVEKCLGQKIILLPVKNWSIK